jgi:phosphoribosylformimino-5-aminoimidazole carboxamide ribotide isomerase
VSGAGSQGDALPGSAPADRSAPVEPSPGRTSFRAIPAVDLKGGRCVQLVGGRPEDERISLPDPVAVARGWRARGFGTLHVVDLDAALGTDGGTADNLELVARIAREAPGDLQVGGGVRDEARARALLDAGAARVIVGTRAVEDPAWLAHLAGRWPRRIAVAADIRDGVVLRRGWTEASELRIHDFLTTLAPLPLAGILCTDVGREGRLEGIDREEVAAVLQGSPHPVWISGGVTTPEELDFLAARGAAGAVLGMALYTGALDPDRVAAAWGGGNPAEG